MPDYSFIAQPKTPEGVQTLGSLVNTAQGAQALQRGQLGLQYERATLQPSIAQQQAQTQSAQTAAQSSAFKLSAEQSSAAMQIAGGLLQDPRIANGDPDGTIEAANEAYGQMVAAGIPKGTADFWASQVKAKARQPGAAAQLLRNITRANAGSATQAGVINAPLTPLNTGGSIVPTQLQPSAEGAIQAGPAGAIQTTITPAERQNVSINPVTASPMTTSKDAQGNVTGVTATPTGAGVPQLAPGQPEDIKLLAPIRSSVNTAAAKVGEHHFNNQQIIKLADETNTGKGSQIVANLRGQYVGMPWTSDSAKNFNSLGHFLALETQTNAQAMGLSTDAARELSGQAVASTGWTKDAIKTAAKVNDALATGLDYFNRGMEKAIADNGGNVLAMRPFQNAWSQAFDPNVYRYANALEANDKAEIAKILGPEGSAQRKAKAAELARKSATLYRLSNEGK